MRRRLDSQQLIEADAAAAVRQRPDEVLTNRNGL